MKKLEGKIAVIIGGNSSNQLSTKKDRFPYQYFGNLISRINSKLR
jgi:hypothetical protein